MAIALLFPLSLRERVRVREACTRDYFEIISTLPAFKAPP
jgi:hypothetical protein